MEKVNIQNIKVDDIVKNELCTGCGACLSNKSKMTLNEFGFLVPEEDIENDVKFCPFNPFPDNEIENEDKLANIFIEGKNNDSKIGHYIDTYVGYSYQYRLNSSSGGIATYVFKKLLEEKIVDTLFIVKEVNGSYEYQFFDNKNKIENISKTRYYPVTLENLFKQIDAIEGTVAVSGVACFIKAIRLQQYYNPDLKAKIPFLIGIICGGLKSSLYTDFLSSSAEIEGQYYRQEYRIKNLNSSASDYSFGAFDDKNDFKTVQMKKLGDMWGTGLFKSNACDFCTDVMTELADISLGDAWLKGYREDGKGNSIIITRSLVADKIIKDGIINNELFIENLSKERAIASQSSSFSHRQDAVAFRIARRIKKNKIVPRVRARLIMKSDFSYKLVQLQRNSVRSKSLKFWVLNPKAEDFNKKMKNELLLLKVLTKINHKLRK